MSVLSGIYGLTLKIGIGYGRSSNLLSTLIWRGIGLFARGSASRVHINCDNDLQGVESVQRAHISWACHGARIRCAHTPTRTAVLLATTMRQKWCRRRVAVGGNYTFSEPQSVQHAPWRHVSCQGRKLQLDERGAL